MRRHCARSLLVTRPRTLDVVEANSPTPQSIPGQQSYSTRITPQTLRALRDDPAGNEKLVRAIADAGALEPEIDRQEPVESSSHRLLCAGFWQEVQTRRSGWIFGWPTTLVVLETFQLDLPVDDSLHVANGTNVTLYGHYLATVLGDGVASDRVQVVYIDVTAAGGLVLLLLTAWWLSRAGALLTMHRMRRLRARMGRCQACGYGLDVLTLT